MRVLICGSRDWDDKYPIRNIVGDLPPNSTVIAGGARGADRIAVESVEERCQALSDIDWVEIKADWDKYGKRAGYLRNIEMLELEPDIVYAFPIGESRGTRHTIREAEKRGIKVVITEG